MSNACKCISEFVSKALLLGFLVSGLATQADEVKLAGHASSHYSSELLRLAFRYSGVDHTVKVVDKRLNRIRKEQQFQQEPERADVLVYTYSPEKNRDFRMVKFPVFLGLQGKRGLLVRDADKHKYTINTVDDVKKLVTLAGVGWFITGVMKDSGFTVHEAPGSQLLRMFGVGRGDLYNRSLTEIWYSIERSKRQYEVDLVFHPGLIMQYPFETFFYVRKSDEALARHIEEGLQKAWAAGEVEKLAFDKLKFHQLAEFLARHNPPVIKMDDIVVDQEVREISDKYAISFDTIRRLGKRE